MMKLDYLLQTAFQRYLNFHVALNVVNVVDGKVCFFILLNCAIHFPLNNILIMIQYRSS